MLPAYHAVLQEYMQLELRVKAHCAAAGSVLLALNRMSAIATQAIVSAAAPAPAGPQRQQQQQQEEASAQQLHSPVQQYLSAELVVKAHCAPHAHIIAAVHDMSIIALQALTQGAQL